VPNTPGDVSQAFAAIQTTAEQEFDDDDTLVEDLPELNDVA